MKKNLSVRELFDVKNFLKIVLYLFHVSFLIYGILNSSSSNLFDVFYLLHVPVYIGLLYIPIQNFVFMHDCYYISPEIVIRYNNKLNYFFLCVLSILKNTIISVLMMIAFPLIFYSLIKINNSFEFDWLIIIFFIFRYLVITLFFNLLNFIILLIFRKIRCREDYRNLSLIFSCPTIFIIAEIINKSLLSNFWLLDFGVNVPFNIDLFSQTIFNLPVLVYSIFLLILFMLFIDRIEFYV